MTTIYVSGMPVFSTDFNKRDASGRLVSLASETTYWLGSGPVGQRVVLKDVEGNSMEAVVDAMDGGVLKFVPQWESWSDGSQIVLEPQRSIVVMAHASLTDLSDMSAANPTKPYAA